MHTKTLFALAGLTLALSMPACRSDAYAPREQARGTEITTHGLNVQDVERVGIELAESLIASNYITAEGEPAAIAMNRFVNNTSQINIDRDRVTNRILQVFVNSQQAVGYTPSDFETLATRGTLPERSYTLNAKIYEDVAELGRDLQVSYIFQMQLLRYTGDGVNPQIWIEERRITTESRRPQ
ncbi:MAG: penicillin-binding protein activator LpoB [Phycisphaera sp.]|nr:MAG: penicillin-binding protein activator LpoB [Phycisphaera sp.]